jgi:hypothetical protein
MSLFSCFSYALRYINGEIFPIMKLYASKESFEKSLSIKIPDWGGFFSKEVPGI